MVRTFGSKLNGEDQAGDTQGQRPGRSQAAYGEN